MLILALIDLHLIYLIIFPEIPAGYYRHIKNTNLSSADRH